MIRLEEIKTLSTKYQTTSLTIAREYCQHNVLASFYNQKGSEKLLFKGGTGGYLAKINFSLYNLKFLIRIEISFRQSRNKKIVSKTSIIENDYIHTYSIMHLPLSSIIDGKLAALRSRAKARDWYDFYFFLHKNILEHQHKKHLPRLLEKIEDSRTDFKKMLKDFLPRSHQMLLKDFKLILIREIKRFL